MKKRWLIYARKIALLEKVVAPRINRLLQAQAKAFISDYKQFGHSTAINNLNKYNLDLLPILNDIYKRAGLIGARITDNELKASVKEGQKAASFGRAAQWIADVLQYLSTNGLEFVQDINETTRDLMLTVLQRGIDQQLSIQEVANQLTDVSRTRAIRIARTEIVRAANIGHQVAARQFPFEVNKKWLAATDTRTRDSHIKVNGLMVDEDDYFKVAIYKKKLIVGYDQMLAPGDPEADPSNTINCRCRVTHIPKRDAKGNLIRRNPNQARIIPLRPTTITSDDLRNAIAASVKMKID